jgi:hypothetical protein
MTALKRVVLLSEKNMSIETLKALDIVVIVFTQGIEGNLETTFMYDNKATNFDVQEWLNGLYVNPIIINVSR